MSALRSLASRLAALALLAGLALALHIGFVAPYLDALARSQDAVEQQARLLARYRAVAVAPRGESAPGDALRGERLRELLLPPLTEGQAAAELQDRVKAFGAAAGVSVASVQILPRQELSREEGSSLARLGIRVRLTADIESLGRLLHAIETHPRALVVDNLAVTARGAPRPGAGQPLEVHLDVIGFQAREAS